MLFRWSLTQLVKASRFLGGIHGLRRCGDCRDGLAQGASQATRDVADFADIGLEVINPWDSP